MIEKDRTDSVMRALMVLVGDEIISADRAREITGWTHEEQREHWRRAHKQAMADVRAAAIEECAQAAELWKTGSETDPVVSAIRAIRALAEPPAEETPNE
jgi:multidrug resistance efflux pump